MFSLALIDLHWFKLKPLHSLHACLQVASMVGSALAGHLLAPSATMPVERYMQVSPTTPSEARPGLRLT